MDRSFTKENFMVLAMLYVANVDGKIQPDEVRAMLDRFEPATVAETRRMFNKMNDTELIACIEENKAIFVPTEADRSNLVNDLHRIVDADDKRLPIEEYMLHEVEALLSRQS